MTEDLDKTDKTPTQPYNDPSTDDPVDTFGKHLKRARLSQHKTLDEAAKATRIHASSLDALENDDRSKLPAEVFTRGFIKIYAKYLELDPQEALNWYDQGGGIQWLVSDEKINAQEVLASEALAESRPAITGRQLLLLTAIIIIGFLSYLGYKTYTSLPVITDAQTKPDVDRELPPITLTPAPDESTASEPDKQDTHRDQKPQAEKSPIVSPGTSSSPMLDKEPPSAVIKTPKIQESSIPQKSEDILSPEHREMDNTTAQIITTPTEDTSIIAKPPTDLQDAKFKYTLKAYFVEQTWLRIQIDDQAPREFTFSPTDQQTWQAKEKIDLFVGNAGGIDLTLNDEPLPQLGKSGKVHRLTIPKFPSN